MRALMQRVAPIAASDAAVIIRGESGTDKEVLARAIHANSPKREEPFLAVNVAALPSELLESELLIMPRKGAFIGALTAKRWLFEASEGGTLLFDESAEMPLALQAKLLRALQDGEIRRVGNTRSFSVDARIPYATNKDLHSSVAQGQFREDLYYRLRVFYTCRPLSPERYYITFSETNAWHAECKGKARHVRSSMASRSRRSQLFGKLCGGFQRQVY